MRCKHWDISPLGCCFFQDSKTQLDTDHIYRLFDFIEQIIILINHNDPYYDHKLYIIIKNNRSNNSYITVRVMPRTLVHLRYTIRWPSDLGAFLAKTFRGIGGEPSTLDRYLVWSYTACSILYFLIFVHDLVEIKACANLFFLTPYSCKKKSCAVKLSSHSSHNKI